MAGHALTRTLGELGMRIKRSAGDGHCLLYSLVASWNAQQRNQPKIDLEMLKTHLVNEVLDHLPEYQVIGDYPVGDALHSYLFSKHYNQDFADVLPLIFANALRVNISIYDENIRNDGYEIKTVETERSDTNKSLIVHRCGDHYNGVVLDNLGLSPRLLVLALLQGRL